MYYWHYILTLHYTISSFIQQFKTNINLRQILIIIINLFSTLSSNYIYTEVTTINEAINSYTAKTSKPYKPMAEMNEIVTKRYVNHCGLLKFHGNREQTAYLSRND